MDAQALIASGIWAAAIVTGIVLGRDELLRAYLFVENDLADKLRRLRASTPRLRGYLITWLVLVVALLLVTVAIDQTILGTLSAALMLTVPWYLIRRMAAQRRQKIEDQLADAMVTLANAIKAGLSLAQSLEILGAQCPKPINYEFQQIVGEYKLGKPIDSTLDQARVRLRSENFALFAAAMLASHESGGRLNETVERIARSVLELQRLERKVQSETAQARKSAVYMAFAPALILTAYYFIAPTDTMRLFTSVPGQVMLAVAVILNIAAYLWARAILNPDM